MLHFIDISSWQGDIDLSPLPIDAVIVKATQGTSYINEFCDKKVQQAIQLGIPWGFYHFADDGDAIEEADYFIKNCLNYFGNGIPVLDWEYDQSVEWVNEFVNRVHQVTGVWCWIYANPWRFELGDVEPNCMRWIASYPDIESPSFEQAESLDCPDAPGLVGAWQFCSDGMLDGYDGYLDCNLFYGDADAWKSYAGVPIKDMAEQSEHVFECEHFRIEVK